MIALSHLHLTENLGFPQVIAYLLWCVVDIHVYLAIVRVSNDHVRDTVVNLARVDVSDHSLGSQK